MVYHLHQHNIGYMADGFYRFDDQTTGVIALNICAILPALSLIQTYLLLTY